MKLGLLLLRSILGALFFGHGTQKLFGWFGGHGPEGTGQFFESLGLRPGRRHAYAAGAAEAAGGALLVPGLFTPLAAALVSGTMVTAIRKVHAPNGPWVSEGGYEYNLVLIGLMFALTDLGPGDWSLDHARGSEASGPAWALAALGAAALGSEIAIRIGQRAPADAGGAPAAPAAAEAPVGAEAPR